MPTKIEWTDETWNPIRARNRETGRAGHFCIHTSPGCANCYAEPMQARLFGNPIRYAAQDAEKVEIFLHQHALEQPSRWKRPRRIFVCSMTDLFLLNHPADMIGAVLTRIAINPQHSFQVLTKRPERGFNCITHAFGATPPPNLWHGVSVEDRERKGRIDVLREIPAAVRFLSLEPLIEDLGELDLAGIGWVIVGGESGPGARPMHPDWARSIRDQCQAAGVPFFFKQWGAWLPGENRHYNQREKERGMSEVAWHQNGVWGTIEPERAWRARGRYVMWEPDGTLHRYGERAGNYFPVSAWATRVGKKRAGRLLDGREWNEMPPTIGG